MWKGLLLCASRQVAKQREEGRARESEMSSGTAWPWTPASLRRPANALWATRPHSPFEVALPDGQDSSCCCCIWWQSLLSMRMSGPVSGGAMCGHFSPAGSGKRGSGQRRWARARRDDSASYAKKSAHTRVEAPNDTGPHRRGRVAAHQVDGGWAGAGGNATERHSLLCRLLLVCIVTVLENVVRVCSV